MPEGASEGGSPAAPAPGPDEARRDLIDGQYPSVDSGADNRPVKTSAPNPVVVTKATEPPGAAPDADREDEASTVDKAEAISSIGSSAYRGVTVLLVVASAGRAEYLRRCLDHVIKHHPK